MTAELTRARIEDALARANAATQGPWGHYLPRGGGSDPVFGDIPGDEVATVNRPNDWRLIAASRSDVPAMAEALIRVLDLHKATRYGDLVGNIANPNAEVLVCPTCGDESGGGYESYPCATVRAITGQESGGSKS